MFIDIAWLQLILRSVSVRMPPSTGGRLHDGFVVRVSGCSPSLPANWLSLFCLIELPWSTVGDGRCALGKIEVSRLDSAESGCGRGVAAEI